MPTDKLVFVDVDTQHDFMLPGGKLYVTGAETLIPAIARLREFAESNAVPIVSSTDAHATDDPEFQHWPPHCIRGTPGQLKLSESLQRQYLVIPRERQTPVTDAELSRYHQFILEKNGLDLFTEPQADELLRRLEADHFVVYGVATEYCVRFAVAGLLERNKRVSIVQDAIRSIDEPAGKKLLAEFEARGAKLTTSAQLLAASSP